MAPKLRLPHIFLARIARSPWLPWGLFVAALVAAIVFLLLWSGERGEDARRAKVEQTASDFLVALTNFSAETIETDVAEIRSFAVGEFADEVEQTFSEERISVIRESEARSIGEVRSVAVQTISGSTASVFGVVDETIENNTTPAPRTEVLRLEIELIETSEGWRVSRVEILQSAAPFAH